MTLTLSDPVVYRWKSGDYSDDDRRAEVLMQFRLIYEGELLSTGNKSHAKEVHALRRKLHPQLRELWVTHPIFKAYGNDIAERAKTFERCGWGMVPLVTSGTEGVDSWVCSLNILFLRRSDPGALVKHGADLDGRIKTLFDALRLPDNGNEMQGPPPTEDEMPLFVLLQNDSLIIEFTVTTDRLLTPATADNKDHVALVIHASVSRILGGEPGAFGP